MFRRLLLSLLIALLGLGPVLHGVQTSEMGAGAVMAVHGGEAPPCDGCDAGGDLAACGAVCGTVAALPGAEPFRLLLSVDAHPCRVARLGERPGSPPDPYPPRFSLT